MSESTTAAALVLRRAAALWFTALLLVVAGCQRGSPQGPLSPPDPTLDRPIGIETQQPTDLDRRLQRLAQTLEEARAEHHVPGMAIAIVKDDRVVMTRGFGMANLESRTPASEETLFSIGSSTKAFTATLVGLQVSDGALAWDDPVSRHVPEFKLTVDSENKDDQITIRDALSHRSGFTRMSLLWISGGVSRSEILSQASKAEPWAPYRSRFLYNNVMYAAAGEAAARSGRTTWAELLANRLLGPLGMTDTSVDFGRTRDDERRAQGYAWRSAREAFEAVPPRDIQSMAPAGAIYSNAADMSRWVRVQLAKGEFEGRQVIPADVVAEAQTQQFQIAPGNGYGLGWFIEEWEGKTVVHHGGNIDGYAAMVALIPEEKTGFAIMFNVGATPLQNLSRSLVWKALLGEDEDAGGAAAEDLSRYTGSFIANFATFNHTVFEVTHKDGRLFVDVPGQMNYELRSPGKDGRRSFALTDTISVSFEEGEEGQVNVMRMHQGGLDFELLRKGYTPPVEIPLSDLAPFEGAYENEKVGRVRVLVQNNRLAVDIPKQMVFELHTPDDKGLRKFRIKPDIAVEFIGKGPDKMVLHEKGQTEEFKRVGNVTRDELPTVAALQKKRGAAKNERALKKAGTIEIRGTVRGLQTGLEGELRIVHRTGEVHVWMDFGRHGKIEEILTAEGAWTKNSFSPLEKHDGKFLAQARLSHPTAYVLDWTKTFDEVSVVSRGVLEGRDILVLRMADAGLDPYEVMVAADTGDVVRVKYSLLLDGPGSLPNELRLFEYRKALGVRVPHRIEVSNEANGRVVWEIESIKRFEGDASAVFRAPAP